MAMLKAPLVFVFNRAAMKAVMVVPMLAPKIKGAALRKETIRCATIGTTTEVVIVLDRMAAVVTVPQKNDFQSFLKKKRLNRSGELASNNLEISFLNNKIELNNNINATSASTKPLGMMVTTNSVTGPNRYKCEAKEL